MSDIEAHTKLFADRVAFEQALASLAAKDAEIAALRATTLQLKADLEASRRCARLAQDAHDIMRARVVKLEAALPFRDYVERTADDILALRVRIEDMRKANEGIAAERDEAIRRSQGFDKNDALRARVAKLEAALQLIKSYAEAHDDEWVPFTVDEALKDAPQ